MKSGKNEALQNLFNLLSVKIRQSNTFFYIVNFLNNCLCYLQTLLVSAQGLNQTFLTQFAKEAFRMLEIALNIALRFILYSIHSFLSIISMNMSIMKKRLMLLSSFIIFIYIIYSQGTKRRRIDDESWRGELKKLMLKPLFVSSIYNHQIKILLSKMANLIKDQTLGVVIQSKSHLSSNPIIITQFQVFYDGKAIESIWVELYQTCIVLEFKNQQKIVLYQMNFDFSLKFEFLRGKNSDKNSWNLFDAYSIKFQRKEKNVQFRYPTEPKHFYTWRRHLSLHLNQGGFHEIFKPMKEIGSGGFARVYLVQNNQDKQYYAVKAFLKESLKSQQEQDGFQPLINQIQTMRALNHKNLMKIEGVYESKNSIYVCVELLEGGQLYEKLQMRYKFSSQEVRTIMKSILLGLESLHELNIMHRDIKPQNILFRDSQSDECVIADFGLAESSICDSLMYVRCGTPSYVAPQIANLKSNKLIYTTACDLFSLGVIFHIMILGKSPFSGKTANEVLEQNKVCKINYDTFQYNQLPNSWLSLLKGLLQKDPKKRLTAKQALAHDFLKKQPLINRKQSKALLQSNQMKSNKENTPLKINTHEREKKTSIQCNSPLMLTKDLVRKSPTLLKQDSCLKFKMRENMVISKVEEGKDVKEIGTPLLKQKKVSKTGQSRFKELSVQNS